MADTKRQHGRRDDQVSTNLEDEQQLAQQQQHGRDGGQETRQGSQPSIAHPPTARSLSDSPVTASSPPGSITTARGRPPPPRSAATTGSSGLSQDIQAKMKAFSLSRQGARHSGAASPSNPPPQGFVGGGVGGNVLANKPAAAARLPGGIPVPGTGGPPLNPAAVARLPGGIPVRGNPTLSPKIGHAGPPKMGGLAAKRGLAGGMKLSDAIGAGPAVDGQSSAKSSAGPVGQAGLGETAFSKYSDMIDTKAGTLTFKDKALLHKFGVDFTSGTSFKISLDDVETLDELGKGNYGTVYKVRHCKPKMRRPGLGLRGTLPSRQSQNSPEQQSSNPDGNGEKLSNVIMAMKEIRLELDEAKFTAIITELDILHRCVSPFIIDFYGAFFQEGAVYICVEYMDGGSMEKLYGDGVPENILRKIALSTVMGLKTLKDEYSIIHRDVKPTNILVNTRGQIKICDFGVSGNLVASIAKTNIGCQSYMAPERIAGGAHAPVPTGGTYSVQSDIWSLGLTLVECAKGDYPYPPDTYANIFSQLNAIVKGDPPQLPDEGYSDEAKDFVNSCLNKNPSLRPSYARLLRHPWLAPLMEPPSEQGSASKPLSGAPASESSPSIADYPTSPPVEIEDKEVADWVRDGLDRLMNGGQKKVRPPLHAVPLDAVPGSPLLEDPSFAFRD
ncbi:hypothetical protein VTO42DRAFT_5952 [Malbranchea cinnamomea]